MRILHSKITSWFAGKATTYYVNAKYDAKVAQALLENLSGKSWQNHTGAKCRVQSLLQSIHPPREKEKTLAVAFTLLYCNGLMDYWLSTLIMKKIIMEKHLPKIKVYEKILTQTKPFYPWMALVIGNSNHLKSFTKSFTKENITFDRAETSQMAILVQKKNIGINDIMAKAIKDKKKINHKISEIINYSKKYEQNQEVFLDSGARTQRAASRWDKIFILMLRK